MSNTPSQNIPGAEKKVVAGILGILLGGFGVHKFYLGYTKEGIIQLLLSFVCVGGIIGIIEGIIYLTKSDEEFVATYVNGRKGWF
jgi:TM2 domain-containing membrane protein YozV